MIRSNVLCEEKQKIKMKIKLRIGPHFFKKWKKRRINRVSAAEYREWSVKDWRRHEIKRRAGTFLTVTTVQRQEEHSAPTLCQLELDKAASLHEHRHVQVLTPFRQHFNGENPSKSFLVDRAARLCSLCAQIYWANRKQCASKNRKMTWFHYIQL